MYTYQVYTRTVNMCTANMYKKIGKGSAGGWKIREGKKRR